MNFPLIKCLCSIKRHVLSFFLFMAAVSAAPAQSSGKYSASVGASWAFVLNDQPTVNTTIPKPYLSFSYNDEAFDSRFVTAGIYNRLDLGIKIVDAFRWRFGGDLLLYLSGDSPRADGTSLDDFEIKAHRYGVFTGPTYAFRLLSIDAIAKLLYRADYFSFYERPTSVVNWTAPGPFWDHGITFRADTGRSYPLLEIFEFGFKPVLYAAYKFRQNEKRWGVNTFLRKVDRYFEGSAGFTAVPRLSEQAFAVVRAQGSYVSKADRMNAIKDGNLNQDSLGMFLGDVRSDRSTTVEAGLKYYFDIPRSIAVKPFVHGMLYREILPDRYRNDFGGGMGVKLLGRVRDKFFWDFIYGNAFGIRSDVHAIHEIKLNLLYSFL